MEKNTRYTRIINRTIKKSKKCSFIKSILSTKDYKQKNKKTIAKKLEISYICILTEIFANPDW